MLFILFRKEEAITRKSVRPFSQYANENKYKNAHTEKENFGFADDGVNKSDNKTVMNGGSHSIHWYRDVVELRKKAEQYRVNLIHILSLPLQLIHVGFFFQNRGWGVEIHPDLYNKQKDLWDQVSRRSSLSALSLASSIHKPITKEEKEAANNKRSSPVKASIRNVSQVHFIDNKLIQDGVVPGRALNIRHHLGRTTGLGAYSLLHSPSTRMPFHTSIFSSISPRYGGWCIVAVTNTR